MNTDPGPPTTRPAPSPGVAIPLVVAAVIVFVAILIWQEDIVGWLADRVGRGERAATFLGWLPIGGAATIAGLVFLRRGLAERSGKVVGRAESIAGGLVLALSLGIAAAFLPGRTTGTRDSFQEALGRGGPAFETAATWATYLVVACVVWVAIVVRFWRDRLTPWLLGAVTLLPPALLLLVVLQLRL